MTRTSALEQLKDMGIPGGRARAALRRAKGDAMAAAERVFAGEYDDIPSDDEGISDEETETKRVDKGFVEEAHPVDEYGEESAPFEDAFVDQDEALDDSGSGVSADPYAGVFFSKDRVEKVIEPEHRTSFEQGSGRAVSIEEWMSGCPEGNEQSYLFQLHNFLSEPEIRCPSPGCNRILNRKFTPFLATNDFPAYIESLRSQRLLCTNCKTLICWACRESVSLSSKPRSEKKRDELFHCANMQGVIVGIGMIMIDQHFETLRLTTIASEPDPTNVKRKASDGEVPLAKKPSLRQIGRSAARGTGYAGNAAEDLSGQKLAAETQARKDQEVATLLKQVQVYLPQLSRESGPYSSDHMIHPTTLAHLRRRSGFINHFLRNDSLLDMSNRGDLYRALFDWLEVVSAHEALASMMAMPQMRPVQRVPVLGEPGHVEVTYEGAPSPRELLENIVIQAHAALKGLKAGEPVKDCTEEKTITRNEAGVQIITVETEPLRDQAAVEDAEVLKTFCERIIDSAAEIDRSLIDVKGRAFVNRMKAELPKLPSTETGAQPHEPLTDELSEEDIVKRYEEWASRVRFEYCDMTIAGADPVAYAHAWSEKIVDISLQDLPRRSIAIAKELATLTTNLPTSWHSSIFLRVDEARVDCIKAMIIGPEGTPYQNGCFLFDIFLPEQYNKASPAVKTMTTNGGLYRYNPNLYDCGKVCLSLLGTWSGPGWVAGQSTLLQVLISIQSLIMCEEPYLNEPAWANAGGTAESKAYSANVRRMCLFDAMGNNLKEPPRPFEDEIRTHFRLKSRAIRKQIDDWKLLDDGRVVGYGKQARTFDQAAATLRALLDELDTGSSAPQVPSPRNSASEAA